MASKELSKIYQTGFDPDDYIGNFHEGNYMQVEKSLCNELLQVFKQGKAKGPRCIDIGAGPMVHRLGLVGNFCPVLVHSDFTDANRESVKLWLKGQNTNEAHRNFFKAVAELEGIDGEDAVKAIEERARSQIAAVIPIDILHPQPIGDLDLQGGPFDCAISNACVEGVVANYEECVKAFVNIGTLLKKGAAFAITGYLNGDFYMVGPNKFPCYPWSQDIIKRAFSDAGFKVDFYKETSYVEEVSLTSEELALTSCNANFIALAYKI